MQWYMQLVHPVRDTKASETNIKRIIGQLKKTLHSEEWIYCTRAYADWDIWKIFIAVGQNLGPNCVNMCVPFVKRALEWQSKYQSNNVDNPYCCYVSL